MSENKKPVRIQRKRTRGFNLQETSQAINGLPCVSVSRPSKWGNPFKLMDAYGEAARDLAQMNLKYTDPINEGAKDWNGYARELALRNYRTYLENNPELIIEAKTKLKGKNLSCWCKIGDACHADILLELANEQ